jgi:hypothetical protein
LVLLFLWFLASLVCRFTKSPQAFAVFADLSAIVFVVTLWPWIRGPYLLSTRGGGLLLHAAFEAQSSTGIGVDGFSRDVVGSLINLGFDRAGILARDVSDRVRTEVMIFVHQANGDSAQVGRVISRSRTLDMLVFKSRFEDGFAFETSSYPTAPGSLPDPNFPVFRFSQIRGRSDLYRIHRKLKERFATSRRPVIASQSEELNDFVVRAEKVHQRIVARDFKLNAANDRYVLTLRGAIRRAWLGTWPVKQIRTMLMERRAFNTARELGLRINPKLGCLED